MDSWPAAAVDSPAVQDSDRKGGGTVDLRIPDIGPALIVGEGSRGAVHRARHSTGAELAVRVQRGFDGDPARLEELLDTVGRMTDRHAHPHVAPVLMAGVTPTGDAYLAEPVLPGGSLRSALCRAPMPVEEVLSLGVLLASGMAAVHEVGGLLGWVAPDAVRRDDVDRPVWCSIGVDRILGGNDRVAAPMAHAAPELLQGLPASATSDVYGLGAVLGHALRGRPLSQADVEESSIVPLLGRVCTGQLVDLAAEGVDEPAAALVRQLMSLDPGSRPRSSEVVAMIQGVQSELGLPVSSAPGWTPPAGSTRIREAPAAPPSPSPIPPVPPRPKPALPGPRVRRRPQLLGWLVTRTGTYLPVGHETWIGADLDAMRGAPPRAHLRLDGLAPDHACIRPAGTGVVLEDHAGRTRISSGGHPPREVQQFSATFLEDGDVIHLGPVELRWRRFRDQEVIPPPPSHPLLAAAARDGLYTEPVIGAWLAAAGRCPPSVVAADIGVANPADAEPIPWIEQAGVVLQDLPVGRAVVVAAGPDGLRCPLGDDRPVPWHQVVRLRSETWGANQQRFTVEHQSGAITWSPSMVVWSSGETFLAAVARIWRAAAPAAWRTARDEHTNELRSRLGEPADGPADDVEHADLLYRVQGLPISPGGSSWLVS